VFDLVNIIPWLKSVINWLKFYLARYLPVAKATQ
jgi:hypothetical protein